MSGWINVSKNDFKDEFEKNKQKIERQQEEAVETEEVSSETYEAKKENEEDIFPPRGASRRSRSQERKKREDKADDNKEEGIIGAGAKKQNKRNPLRIYSEPERSRGWRRRDRKELRRTCACQYEQWQSAAGQHDTTACNMDETRDPEGRERARASQSIPPLNLLPLNQYRDHYINLGGASLRLGRGP